MNANLLVEEVFGVRRTDGRVQHLSLPALLEGLGDGTVEALTGIQRHQVDAWHMFVCNLAAAVLEGAGQTEPGQSEEFWRERLREVAGRRDDLGWTLVGEDPTQPAFMQPPVSRLDDFETYRPKAGSPDELDVLQTAKNHDLKAARMANAAVEDWAYALVSLQTMSGFLGQGNYGISRMNGGFASRICVEAVPDHQPAARWRHVVRRLLQLVPGLLPPTRPFQRSGHCLLWLLPWDGKSGLALDALHPFFIEVCRLVRLVPRGTGLEALGKPSQVSRITVPREVKGNVGDPWTPLRRSDNAALTVGARGLDLKLLRDLVLGGEEYEPAPMQKMSDDARPSWLHAAVLVRGQGTTDGFHEARIYIAPKCKTLLLRAGPERDRLAQLSDWALQRARDVRSKALRPALFAVMEGGPEGWPDTNRREISAWSDRWLADFDTVWGQTYFPWLWDTIDLDDAPARDRWLRGLKSRAQKVLEQALMTAPQRTGRRYRGRVRAQALFHVAFRKHFGQEMIDVAA